MENNDRREFVKKSGLGLLGVTIAPSFINQLVREKRLRTAHIGVGGMGGADLEAISSHNSVDVIALCDVDANNLAAAAKLHPKAKTFTDYRIMLKEMGDKIDAVIVSTPDHTHAPASMLAMNMDKPVYCQKPLTHHVSEARAMRTLAEEKNLVTQMGIQIHSYYDYILATLLIQSGIVGKVHTVKAWSPKNWGYNGAIPEGSDSVPTTLDWNLWLGTAAERPYKDEFYHPAAWRKLLDFGCATLGDMGVHIFDTPYYALKLDVPRTITANCRKPNGFGYPEQNMVTYEFPGTEYTADTLKWVWYDGEGADKQREDLMLPGGEQLPEQGAMFIGEQGRLLLQHSGKLPLLIVDSEYKEMDIDVYNLGTAVRNSKKHYHQFVDACLGKDKTSAPFSYASRLTETILLGVIAQRFPYQTLHWDSKTAKFSEDEANQYLDSEYRKF